MEGLPLPSILINILNPDNSARHNAEVQYSQTLDRYPSNTTFALIEIMVNHPDPSLKSLSGVLLKQSFERHWINLDLNSQKSIQRLVLEVFSNSISHHFLKISCDVIGKLAICVKQTSRPWPEFSQFLLNCVSGKDDWQIFTGFKVLSEIFAFYSEELSGYKEKLYQSFLKHFFHLENEVKSVCCLCFVQAITVLSTAETKYFIGLLQGLFKSILSINSSGLVGKVLESLRDLGETEPLFFKNKLVWCLQLAEGLVKGYLDISCKYLGLEFLVILTESYPNLMLGSNQALFGYLELFRLTFTEIIGNAADSVEIDYEQLILTLVGRSIKALRGNFAQFIIEYLASNTENSWKFKYFSILLLTEAATEIFGTGLFDPLMKYVLDNMQTGNEQVKLACFKTLNKFILKFKTKFTGKYSESVETSIKIGFNCGDWSVIQASLELFVEFLRNLHNYELQFEVKETLLNQILGFLKLNPVCESVLKAIETAADSFKRSVPWFFNSFYPELTSLYSSTSKISQKAALANTLISLRKTIKRKDLIPHLPEIFQMLKFLSQCNYSSDTFKYCVLENWKFLVKHFGSEFSIYLSEIVPGLLMHISNDREDIEEHLETLLVIIEATQESFIAFLNATSKIILELIVNDVSDPIRALSCTIGAVLVEIVLKTSNSESKEGVIKFSKQFFVAICQVCVYEQDVSTLVEMLQSLQRIISAPSQSFLTKTEIEILGDMLIQFLHSQSTSPQLRKTASQILSTMFKTHTSSTVNLLDFIYINLLDKYLTTASQESEKLFALSIFSDIISVIGNGIVTEKLEKVVMVLLNYAKGNERKLKIEAIKGIVEGAKALKPEKFKVYAEGFLRTLEMVVLAAARKKSERKVFEWAVSAVCFMIYYQEACLKVEMVLPWVSGFLPLENIVVAGKINDIFVGFLVNEYSGLIVNPSVLNSLIRISACAVCNKSTYRKVKRLLLGHLKNTGVEVLYSSVHGANHQYLNKLLQ